MTDLQRGYLFVAIQAVALVLTMLAVTFCLHPVVGTAGVTTGWTLATLMIV